ncbi:MAG: nitroreductase family protein [Rikenellaceae bacterium]
MENVKNNTLDTIHSRKSVRSYTEQQISQEELLTLVKAGMAAPTGKNVQPWELIVVTDREKLDYLSGVLPYAKMLKNAPAAIVVCGNDDTENGGSSYWYVDCSAATQNILLAAESMGIGAVWTATYPYAERMNPVAEIFNLPTNIKSLCVIPLGYPSKEGRAKDKFKEEKVHFDKW